jgi:hypothetical protein
MQTDLSLIYVDRIETKSKRKLIGSLVRRPFFSVFGIKWYH